MTASDDLLSAVRDSVPKSFKPCAYYDPDGDCIEFHATAEDFHAERLDRWVTVYRGEKTGKIVGSQIKQLRKLLIECPGINIEIEDDGKLCLAHFIRACAWKQGDEVAQKTYKLLISQTKGIKIALPHAA